MRSVAAVALAFTCLAIGQEFEVISIKPNKSGPGHSGSHSDRGILKADNMSLRQMIASAYGIKDYQLEGPDWLASERFDVSAKFPENLPSDREKYAAAMFSMLQKMLVDRFKLAVHREQKALPVYGLVVAKHGIKFKQVPDQGSRRNSNNTHFTGTCSMDLFADFLSRRMDMPVIDMTGLKGMYEMTLDWAPEPAADSDDTPKGLALPDALEAQLGLKLEHRKAPIEILVVDHAERVPSDN